MESLLFITLWFLSMFILYWIPSKFVVRRWKSEHNFMLIPRVWALDGLCGIWESRRYFPNESEVEKSSNPKISSEQYQ